MLLLLWVLLYLGCFCLDDIFAIVVNISFWLLFRMHPILDQGCVMMVLDCILSFHISQDCWAIVLGHIYSFGWRWWLWLISGSRLSRRYWLSIQSAVLIIVVFIIRVVEFIFVCGAGMSSLPWPHSSGHSGSWISGWVRWSTSWFQYFFFRDPKCLMCVDGKSLNRRLTMKFFPVICGLPTHCVSLQHDVIILLAGWSCGPCIIFPM